MEYLYPIGWMLMAFAVVVCGLAQFFRWKCPDAPDLKILDLAPTVELLRDVANYLMADASQGGKDYRYKLEIEAKRLTGGK